MLKPEQIKLEDSNLALFGSEVEKNVKLAAAKCEREWDGAGSQPGLEIWRVEKFQIKKWPKDQYGSFYNGDSYIILKTYRKPNEDKLYYNVHFWLGTYTSQDEAGTAAYKTVELDTLLKDVPVQYREVQGFETNLFLTYFSHIKLLQGGVESGFKHVEEKSYVARLLQFKGKKNIRVWQVPLSRESLNEGDVFLLDNGNKLYLWQGKQSGVFERRKGNELLGELKVERKNAQTFILEQDDNDAEFWKLLGGKGTIRPAVAGGDDNEAEQKAKEQFKLFRINDKSGFKLEAQGQLSKNSLDGNDVFLLDNGYQIFIWVGKGASREERSKAMMYAMNYIKQQKLAFSTPIARLVEGGETDEFNAAFPLGGQAKPGNPAAHASSAAGGAPASGCCTIL